MLREIYQALGGWLGAALLLGCQTSPAPSGAPSATSAATSVTAATSAAESAPQTSPRLAPMSGPALLIQAGKGVGPIRLGATVATIERLMAAKCEELSEERCRFVGRAVDFELADGVTVAVVAYRPGRAASPGKRFGYFNGGFPPDLRLGMTPEAIQEGLGKPKRVEQLHADPSGAIERHYYDGMVLDYDQPAPPRLALGAARIVRP